MGGKLPNAPDRRVQRTRRALGKALVELMIERGWEGFTVQDVCDRADVGRSTFYTHYADKEELVGSGFEDLKDAVRAQAREAARAGGSRPLAFSRGLIDHAFEQRRLFAAIVGKRSGFLVQRKFRDLVLELVREDLAGTLPAGSRRDAAVSFLAGALLELLSWSLSSRLGPEAVDGLFHEMVSPVLRVAARG